MNRHALICYLILLAFFTVTTVTDVKRREISWQLAVMAFLALTFGHIVSYTTISKFIIAAFLFGTFYLLEAIFVTGSGGDIIMAALLGYGLGLSHGAIAFIISGIGMLALFLYRRHLDKRVTLKTEVPLAPFLCLGIFVEFILRLSGILSYDWRF